MSPAEAALWDEADALAEEMTEALERIAAKVSALEAEIMELRSDPKRSANVAVYRGGWRSEATYTPGQMVTHRGALWHCHEPTASTPGDSSAWQLMAKTDRTNRKGNS